MGGLILLTSIAIAAGTIITGASPGATGEKAAGNPNLIFHEDFSGKGLDRSRWSTCYWWASKGCTIGSNNELEWYLPQQVKVRRGVARLIAEKRAVQSSDGTDYPYVSGMINTGPRPDEVPEKFAFTYGKVRVRAKLPAGRGLWSAIWMLPVSRESKPEIDVAEILGHRPSVVEMHSHWRDGEGEVQQIGDEWKGGPSLRRGKHVFGINWRPGSLKWLVDGEVRYSVSGDAVPDEPMYLLINLAVGGDWPGSPDGSTRFPRALVIDDVKVWK